VVAVIGSAVGDPFTRDTPGARVLCLSTRVARGRGGIRAAAGWVGDASTVHLRRVRTLWAVWPARRKFTQDDVGF
jgi:hypothetical protein